VHLRPLRLPALLSGALFALAAGRGALAQTAPTIPGVSSWVTDRELRVEATLSPGLPEEVRQRLGSGLATTVSWQIRLFLFRNLWWDALKDARRSGAPPPPRPAPPHPPGARRPPPRLLDTRILPTKEEAAAALTRLGGLPVFTMGDHLLGKKLVVRLRCRYGDGFALGVVPTSDVTDWTRSGVFEWTASGAR